MKHRVFAGLFAISIGLVQGPVAHTRAESTPAASTENEAKAREAFQAGRAYYGNGEFDSAAEAFEEAYRLSGRDVLFYNIYLAYRDANEPERAADALRNYLTRVSAIDNRAQLEARLTALDEGIAARKADEQRRAEEQQALVQNQAATQQDETQATAPERYWLMPVVLVGVGAGMALGSVGTGLVAKGKQGELDDECADGVCPGRLQDTADQGKTLAIATDVLLFGGLAVAATGAVLFWLKRPRSNETPVAAARASGAFMCHGKGCGASMAVRF